MIKIIKNSLNFAKKHCFLIVFAAFALCSCNANKSAQIAERFAFDSAQNVDFSSREKFADYAGNLKNGDFTKGKLHKCSESRIEFARSIITKDGHIISACIGGIEQDLGKEKAAEIAKTLAGDNIQYGVFCEIEDAPGGDSPKQLARTEKEGYFCTEE